MLAELKSAGLTTPCTVIDCLSELTPMSLVPSITRFPLNADFDHARGKSSWTKTSLRDVDPA